MKCKKIRKQLIAYLNTKLSSKAMEQIANHLKHCPACNKELNDWKAFWQLLNNFQPVNKLPYAEEDFLTQVRRKIRTQPGQPRRNILLRLLPAFASAIILLAIITILRLNLIKPYSVSDEFLFSSLNQEDLNGNYLYGSLDQKTQELINEQLIAKVLPDEAESLAQELLLTTEPIDLFSQLSDFEKENVVNELLKKYQHQAKSLGGKNG